MESMRHAAKTFVVPPSNVKQKLQRPWLLRHDLQSYGLVLTVVTIAYTAANFHEIWTLSQVKDRVGLSDVRSSVMSNYTSGGSQYVSLAATILLWVGNYEIRSYRVKESRGALADSSNGIRALPLMIMHTAMTL